MTMTKEEDDTCLEQARMDLEMLTAAFPDEVVVLNQQDDKDLPLTCRLLLNNDSFIEMEFVKGYPTRSTLQVISQRCQNHQDRVALEAAVSSIKSSASLGEEHGLTCCAAALQAFQEKKQQENDALEEEEQEVNTLQQLEEATTTTTTTYNWFTGTQSLTDRKSVFVAHVCKVESEQQVHQALHQLLDGNSKLQRATHNMVAWRVTEVCKDGTTVVEKHDNDDDGETGAGSRLAHLLQMRNEKNMLVVVSRWYGGIHLGSKRFAHIANVAQQALQEYHEKEERQTKEKEKGSQEHEKAS